jgi:MFS family permease
MVVVSFVIMGLQFGALVSISVFLKPLVAEFGWERGNTAFAYTAGTGAVGLGGIVMGWMADRFSTRPVVLFGAVMLGLSLLLLSYLETLWQLYLFYCILGGLGFAALNVPIITNVGQWFSRNKGLALGIVSAGGALGQGLVPYFARYLMIFSGWRGAYTTLAVIFWAVLLPLALLIRTPPRLAKDRNASASGNPRGTEEVYPIAPAKVVIWLSIAVIFCCICMATPIIHVVALASDMGFDSQSAVGVLSLIIYDRWVVRPHLFRKNSGFYWWAPHLLASLRGSDCPGVLVHQTPFPDGSLYPRRSLWSGLQWGDDVHLGLRA